MARSTFKVLFYVNGSKERNGIVPIMGRVTINGTVAQFSCKQSIPKTLWDVKGNKARGKSREARDINLALDNIKAQIIKHYQRISDREAYVTAEMVRNAYQGIGNEYETLIKAFDKDCANFFKRCRQRPKHWYIQGDGKGKELCCGVYQIVLQTQRYVNVGTYPRLHQGVCRLPHHGKDYIGSVPKYEWVSAPSMRFNACDFRVWKSVSSTRGRPTRCRSLFSPRTATTSTAPRWTCVSAILRLMQICNATGMRNVWD